MRLPSQRGPRQRNRCALLGGSRSRDRHRRALAMSTTRLSFALRGSLHQAFIFEVQWHLFCWLAKLQRCGPAPAILLDAAGLTQDLEDASEAQRGRRPPAWVSAGSPCPSERIASLWSWDAPQVLRRLLADLHRRGTTTSWEVMEEGSVWRAHEREGRARTSSGSAWRRSFRHVLTHSRDRSSASARS
jgi:hypothetical protein